ncbi:hypothetical protein F5890DRAFT_1393553, partial [Lentinula detonsa]
LPTNLAFNDFFSRICAHMDLDPVSARIGYKIVPGQRARDIPYQISNKEEYRVAVTNIVDRINWARTREVFMEILNLVCKLILFCKNLLTIFKDPPRCTVEARGMKRTNQVNDETLNTNLNFNKQLRELREHPQCQKHHGHHCYIDPITADHRELDIATQTHWAKLIFLNQASLERLPNNLIFDHKHTKRAHVSQNSSSNAPPIHVHLNGV